MSIPLWNWQRAKLNHWNGSWVVKEDTLRVDFIWEQTFQLMKMTSKLSTVSVECPPILHDLQYIYGLWLQYGCYEWVLNLACEVVQCVLYFIKLFNEDVYPAYVSVTWQPHFQALSSHWSYWPCYVVHCTSSFAAPFSLSFRKQLFDV